MTKRCVIVGGADINNYECIAKELNKNDFFIFCDCGLKHQAALGVNPDLIVGDFDSYKIPQTNIETIILPCEKDDTDTYFAAKEGLKRGFSDFLLIGMIGNRFDHSLGNLYILQLLEKFGAKAKLIDDYSEMEIVSGNTAFVDDSFKFFSVINITGNAEGILIKNAKYPLSNAKIECEYQYGISNETVHGTVSEVSVSQGSLLLIKIRR